MGLGMNLGSTFRAALRQHSERLSDLQLRFPELMPADFLLLKCRDPEQLQLGLPSIAVVGTRRPTPYGLRFVRALVKELSGYRINWVSGGAMGIDAEVHTAALANGAPTQAWLVGPVDYPSPQSNQALFEQIARSAGGGLIVPECLEPSPRNPVHKSHWLQRNQWLVGACDALIVVEAALASGTWSTARMAHKADIPTYALPGPIDSPQSIGTNKMISIGWAHPVESVGLLAKRLVVDMRLSSYNGVVGRGLRPRPSLAAPEDENKVLKILDKVLCERGSLQVQDLGSLAESEHIGFEDLAKAIRRQVENDELFLLGNRFEKKGGIYES